jgi:hypothetical protein
MVYRVMALSLRWLRLSDAGESRALTRQSSSCWRNSRRAERFGVFYSMRQKMAKLTYGQRKAMPKSEFALPAKKNGGKGGYPIEDKDHARNALARVSQFGSPSEKKKVRAAVHHKYPSIGHPKSHQEFEDLGK